MKQCEAGCEAAHSERAAAEAAAESSSSKQKHTAAVVVAKLLESVAKEVFYKGLCV